MSVYLPYKHPFRFRLLDGRSVTFWAKVKPAKEPVALTLKAEHVQESMKVGGQGSTNSCTMAICAKRQANEFPHPVDGFIDWTYSRAHVVTKTRANGAPVECVVYEHRDDIAYLNDIKGGQKKLLSDLRKNGDKTITLNPMRKHESRSRGVRTKTGTGKKKNPSTRVNLKGANLRYAVATAGGIAA